MLSINPKQRPTILDVLNKSFIKKRVITYFNEILSGNYPEANLPHDVDDVYIIYYMKNGCIINFYRFILIASKNKLKNSESQ